MYAFLRARRAFGIEYLIVNLASALNTVMLRYYRNWRLDFFSKIDTKNKEKIVSLRFKVREISNMIPQIFPRTGRISGPDVGDGAKPEVPTTYLEKKNKKTCILWSVDVHARCCLKSTKLPFIVIRHDQMVHKIIHVKAANNFCL